MLHYSVAYTSTCCAGTVRKYMRNFQVEFKSQLRKESKNISDHGNGLYLYSTRITNWLVCCVICVHISEFNYKVHQYDSVD